MRKPHAALLAAAIAMPLATQAALAGPRQERHELRQQLRHDRHDRHEAREKLHADLVSGNQSAIAGDRAALEAANGKVQADKEALRQLRK